jgi:ABC-2 type transport system permease protein
MSVTLAGAFAGESYRLVRRRFFWLSVAASGAVGLLGSLAPRVEELVHAVQRSVGGEAGVNTPSNAFFYFATGAKGTVVVAALFTALAASSAVAGEAHAGTMRLLLCRPVKRLTIFASKFLVLLSLLTALLAAGFAGAAVGAAFAGDYGPVVVILEKSTAEEMVGRALYASLLAVARTSAILAVALLASVLSRAAAAASAAALGALVLAELLAGVLDVVRPWLFSAYARNPFDTLRDFAMGIDAPRPIWFGIPSLRDWADASFALGVPLLTATVLTLVSARVFARKDWLA